MIARDGAATARVAAGDSRPPNYMKRERFLAVRFASQMGRDAQLLVAECGMSVADALEVAYLIEVANRQSRPRSGNLGP